MLLLTAEDVRQALPMTEVIQAMKLAYAALSDNRADVPLRTRLPIPGHDAVSLFMPAYVQTEAEEALAVKVVSLFPGNPTRGLAFIQAAVMVFEADTGRAIALIEGTALTAIRTGAGSGAATDLLARPDSHVAAVFGAGTQGRTQLEAACAVRRIEQARVYDPDVNKAAAFAAELAGHGLVPNDLKAVSTPQEAVATADIICTATTATAPVFADRDLKRGAHISAIGSYTPEMQEVPAETIQRAKVVVDSRSAVLAETGDLIKPIQSGLISAEHIFAELGEIVLGRRPGRTSPEEITYFKSVGVAVQDAIASQLAVKNARVKGLGQEIAF